MAKNETTSSKSEKQSKSEPVKLGKTQGFLIAILIVVVIQLLLTLGLVFSGENSPANTQKLENIEEKVNAIDSFFGTYVDGYDSPSGSAGTTGGSQGGSETPSEPADIDLEGEPTMGSPDAPVTIVEFSDYECPFCARFFTDTYPQLKEEYIETGKVRLVFKDFPLSFHPNAESASVAANCVQKLEGDEAYFEYHDALFENQRSLNTANYKVWAEELGVNADDFATCLADQSMIDEVQADFLEGSQLGVSGTPSFFINGELVVGAQPYSVIKQTIESKLSN